MSSRGTLTLSLICILLCVNQHVRLSEAKRNGEINVEAYRERVKRMFYHAYNGYLTNAYPYDELQPLTCGGHDTWGSYSLTLIDAMDTLVVMGNYSEFRRIAEILMDKGESFFDIDINVSVFETNIRIVGGLLSAHLMMKRAGMVLEPAWPCSGPLLRMADNIARKILPAFDTPTGMPYGTVNLRHGVPKGETTVTCTAGVGTFIIEFGALSHLTGDPIFEKTAIRAIRALWKYRSSLGLLGNHIDVSTGKWTAQDSGIGGGIDSYFEYLVKGAVMFNIPELFHMFRDYEVSVKKYLKRDDWYMWAQMTKGTIYLPLFTSLDGYWPSIKGMLGDIDEAMKTMHNFHQVWRQFGFTPEYYNIPKADVHSGREGYPLRPEIIESAMYLYRATKDPYLLEIGVDIVESIEHSARTSCGYATVKDVRDHRLEDRMESFFLAETTKYLYLLFDPDNFIHNNGSSGSLIHTPSGQCVIEAGGYIFNTEAHPLDLAAVHCCSAAKKEEDRVLQEFHDNLDLLSLLDLVDSNDAEWMGEIWKKKKKRKMKKKETDEMTGKSLPSDVISEKEKEIPHVDEEDEDDDDDFADFDDDVDKEFIEWASKDVVDTDPEKPEVRIKVSSNLEQVKKPHVHLVDMTIFTEKERNFTRVFMEELQMDFIMKNISQQIAETLKQHYQATEHESLANDVARKLLEATASSENSSSAESTESDKGSEETEPKLEEQVRDEDKVLLASKKTSEEEIGVKSKKIMESLEPVVHITITTKDDAQNVIKQNIISETGTQSIIVQISDDKQGTDEDASSTDSSSPSSPSLQNVEAGTAKVEKSDSADLKENNLATERFKSHIELQIQTQDDQQNTQDKTSMPAVPASKVPTAGTPSPLEAKRSNLLSLTNKLLTMFSGISTEESKESTVTETRTPSIAGLYEALAKYPLNYFHNPTAMHCPAQPFHQRISVYGEMFPEEL